MGQRVSYGEPNLGSVIIIPIDIETGRVALVRGSGERYWRFPGGRIEVSDQDQDGFGQTLINAGLRNMRSATGIYTGNVLENINLHPICKSKYQLHPIVFAATNFTAERAPWGSGTDIVDEFSPEEISKLIDSGKFLWSNAEVFRELLKCLNYTMVE